MSNEMSRGDKRVFNKMDAKLGKLIAKQIQSNIEEGRADPGSVFASMTTALTGAVAKTLISASVSFGRPDDATREATRKTADKLVEMVDELLKSDAVKMTRQLRDSVVNGGSFKPRRFGSFSGGDKAEDNVVHMRLVNPEDEAPDPADAPDSPDLTDPVDEPAPSEEDDA